MVFPLRRRNDGCDDGSNPISSLIHSAFVLLNNNSMIIPIRGPNASVGATNLHANGTNQAHTQTHRHAHTNTHIKKVRVSRV